MKYKIILTLFTISLIFSTLLALTPETICPIETSSCATVQNSQYTNILGINNAIIGVVAFSILILITILHILNPRKKTKIFLATSLLFATITALHFLYLQIFIIRALCPYCMIIDISTITALIILITNKKTNVLKTADSTLTSKLPQHAHPKLLNSYSQKQPDKHPHNSLKNS